MIFSLLPLYWCLVYFSGQTIQTWALDMTKQRAAASVDFRERNVGESIAASLFLFLSIPRYDTHEAGM